MEEIEKSVRKRLRITGMITASAPFSWVLILLAFHLIVAVRLYPLMKSTSQPFTLLNLSSIHVNLYPFNLLFPRVLSTLICDANLFV